jgi:hypothetical protein
LSQIIEKNVQIWTHNDDFCPFFILPYNNSILDAIKRFPVGEVENNSRTFAKAILLMFKNPKKTICCLTETMAVFSNDVLSIA